MGCASVGFAIRATGHLRFTKLPTGLSRNVSKAYYICAFRNLVVNMFHPL
jgi:hypothetical protein